MIVPKQFLVRQTTFGEYVQRTFGSRDQLSESFRNHLARREAELQSLQKPGDELWEWDMGGWDELCGRSGLAIVRDGQVIKSSMMLLS